MQEIEPSYQWENIYEAAKDKKSPFYGRSYSQTEYEHDIYGYYIHPNWDEIDSETLYCKILFTDYEAKFTIIELFGEWNDTLHNDIMHLKRNVIDHLLAEGIKYFTLVGENVFNFHNGDRDYYEELYEELSDENGWAVLVNMHQAAQHDFLQKKLNRYIELMEFEKWRTYKPEDFFQLIDKKLNDRLGI